MNSLPTIRLMRICLTLFALLFLSGCSEVYSTRRILCGLEGDDVDSISVYASFHDDLNPTNIWKRELGLSKYNITTQDKEALELLLQEICELEPDQNVANERWKELDSIDWLSCDLIIKFNDQMEGLNILQGRRGVLTHAWPDDGARILWVIPYYYNRIVPYSNDVWYESSAAGSKLLTAVRSILINHGRATLADSLITQQRRIPNPAKRKKK